MLALKQSLMHREFCHICEMGFVIKLNCIEKVHIVIRIPV